MSNLVSGQCTSENEFVNVTILLKKGAIIMPTLETKDKTVLTLFSDKDVSTPLRMGGKRMPNTLG